MIILEVIDGIPPAPSPINPYTDAILFNLLSPVPFRKIDPVSKLHAVVLAICTPAFPRKALLQKVSVVEIVVVSLGFLRQSGKYSCTPRTRRRRVRRRFR